MDILPQIPGKVKPTPRVRVKADTGAHHDYCRTCRRLHPRRAMVGWGEDRECNGCVVARALDRDRSAADAGREFVRRRSLPSRALEYALMAAAIGGGR